VAPSLIPRKPGEPISTNQVDALSLAQSLRGALRRAARRADAGSAMTHQAGRAMLRSKNLT
jgi:hypothetical protein